ncbi:hypothetical protein BH23BAC3_BH23BAC3_35590 [soil metagenome]
MEKKLSLNTFYSIVTAIILIGFGVTFFGEGIRELIYGRIIEKLDYDNMHLIGIIDSRVSENFIQKFNHFVTTPEFYFGYGYYWDELYSSTNWRGVLFKFGLVGISIIISLIIGLSFSTNKTYGLILITEVTQYLRG